MQRQDKFYRLIGDYEIRIQVVLINTKTRAKTIHPKMFIAHNKRGIVSFGINTVYIYNYKVTFSK